MPIAGERPESGVRIAIARHARGEAPPWVYSGAAHVPDASFDLRVVVAADGVVEVELDAAAPRDLAEKVRLIVRTAYKQAHADGEPPPRRIVRWRAGT